VRDAASHLTGSDDADLLDIECHAACSDLMPERRKTAASVPQPGNVLAGSVRLRHSARPPS
jgi:hypothetical protein